MMKAVSALAAFIIFIDCFKLAVSFDDDNNFLLRSHVLNRPQFPSVDLNEICYEVFFEARPFPGNSNFFVGCIRGTGLILQCFEDEIFDANSLKCVKNQETSTTTTTSTTQPPDLDKKCEGLFFDFIEHPSDCGKAIFCFNQTVILRECPAGTIFDVNLEEYENISHFNENDLLCHTFDRCRSGNRETCTFYMLPSTNVPVETTTEPDLSGICDGIDLGFIAHPTDCGFAIFCFNQEKVLRECPENQIFDITNGICRPGDRVTCVFKDDQVTTTTRPPVDLDGICYGRDSEFIEHPTDCGKAIFCFNQYPVLRECPENTIFDINIENCREGDRETCLFVPRQEKSSRSLCEGLQDALIPHEMDLRKFYRCADGMIFNMKCDYNEIFDSEKKKCLREI